MRVPPSVILLLAILASPCVHGNEDLQFTRSRHFRQTGAGSPVAIANHPYRFDFAGRNLGLLAPAGTLILPSGQTRTAPRVGQDFVFQDVADSAVLLEAAYGAGTYTLSIRAFGFVQTSSVNLVAAPYPPVPQLHNFAATQGFAADEGIELEFGAFPGGGEDDWVEVVLKDSRGQEVYRGSGSPETTSFYLGGDFLQPGREYQLELSFVHLAGRSAEGAAFNLAAAVASTTVVSMRTSGSGGETDTTSPMLVRVDPADGGALATTISIVSFTFSEPMDRTLAGPVFTASRAGNLFPLDAEEFLRVWNDEGTVLQVAYNPSGPGWPGGVIVRWAFDEGENAGRDQAGNALPAVSGAFSTSPGGTGTGCEGASPLEVAGFGILKIANFLQTSTGLPGNDPTNGAAIQAFARVPDAVGRAAIEFPADPAPPPHALKFFGGLPGGLEFLAQGFGTTQDLEAAYPPGFYDFQFRDRSAPTTVLSHVVLTFTAAGYPPIPRFANYAAAQSIDVTADFTLAWDAWSGASTATDSLSVEIVDEDQVVVFARPDACHQKPLSVADSATVVPRDTLKAGRRYEVRLSFFRLNDQGQPMPQSTAKGVTAIGRSTRMVVATPGGVVPPSAPRFLRVGLNARGQFQAQVECTVGRQLTLEVAPAWDAAFIPWITTNPPVSPLELALPVDSTIGFLRARTD